MTFLFYYFIFRRLRWSGVCRFGHLRYILGYINNRFYHFRASCGFFTGSNLSLLKWIKSLVQKVNCRKTLKNKLPWKFSPSDDSASPHRRVVWSQVSGELRALAPCRGCTRSKESATSVPKRWSCPGRASTRETASSSISERWDNLSKGGHAGERCSQTPPNHLLF